MARLALALGAVSAIGCGTFGHYRNVGTGRSPAGIGTELEPPTTSLSGTTATPDKSPEKAAAAAPNEQLAATLAELQALGDLDPATQARLNEDLKRTPVELWPELVQTFKTTLAYRRQLEERRTAKAVVTTPEQVEKLAEATAEAGTVPAATDVAPPGSVVITLEPDTSESSPPIAAASPSPANQEKPAPATLSESQVVLVTDLQPADSPGDSPATASLPETAAAPETPAAASWKQHLALAISELENETADSSTPPTAHGALRLLRLVDGQRDAALRPVAGVPPLEQEFWNEEVYGLSICLTDSAADPTRRSSEALVHLRNATGKLAESASLVVRNLHFCTEVSSYGVFKKFEKDEFKPGQEVLLYAEVDNFKSVPSERGYHTALKSRYQILDARGAIVAEQELALTEEHCRNQRRDFFIRYFLWMPKRVYDGRYTLQLTIEDTLGQKLGQSAIEFSVKE